MSSSNESPERASAIGQSIESRKATIGVIGLGYVGLPLIDAFVRGGFSCMGFDVDPRKVESLRAGKSYIKHISNEKIAGWIEGKSLEATHEMSRLAEPDVLIICVPTPLTDTRDPLIEIYPPSVPCPINSYPSL